MSIDGLNLDVDALQHRLAELPENVLPHIKMGFDVLSKVDQDKRVSFIDFFIDSARRGKGISRDKAADLLGLRAVLVGDILTAVALCLGAVVDLSVSVDQFIALAKDKLFDAAQESVVYEIVTSVVASRDIVKSGMDKSALANAVLPSYKSSYLEIDVRLEFLDDSDEMISGVSLAVVYIDTDCEQQLWFQASKDDLISLKEKIDKALQRLDKAQVLIQERWP